MKAELELVTPHRAEHLLGTMVPNRNIRRLKVQQYAQDMADGRWLPTGEPIKVTGGGRVIDGEHRLRAVIQSQVTVEMLIVYGVEIAARVAMDTGASRSLGDHLKFLGEKQVNELASALAALWIRHYGSPKQDSAHASHQQLLSMLETHPGIRESVQITARTGRRVHVSAGLCAALHYDMTAIDADDADGFWHQLDTGAGLHDRHPILALRRKLEDNQNTLGRKIDRVTKHAYIVKAWNAYREGRDLSILKWTRGGANPQPFPELQ